MKPITFFVTGDPKGQPRPRAFARGGQARVYDPGTAEGWKSLIAFELRRHWDRKQVNGPISVDLIFHLRRPKSHYNRKGLKLSAPCWHTQKPDSDNLAKAVLDALTQCGVWHDDSQVARLVVLKKWETNLPGCFMRIESADDV